MSKEIYDSADEAEFLDPKRNGGGEEEGNDEDTSQGFNIGTVVFPVEKTQDFVDSETVLINNVDTYIGKYIGQYLSEKLVGASLHGDDDDEFEGEEEGAGGGKCWKVLGTFKETKSVVPQWLWAVMQNENYDAYMKEILKCQVIIYDVTDNPTQEKFDEIRAVCDALREKVPVFKTRRIFILISSAHTWSHTKPPDPKDPDVYLSEYDYRRRCTKPIYRDLQLLERYVVASGKMTQGMLKSYVIGAGAVYGAGEGPLHFWFKSAWHNAKFLQIYGSGKNFIPTIYIKDLSAIVQNVMDYAPKGQRYILAVDLTLCQQDQIVKAVSNCLGTGRVKKVEEEDIYSNRELTTFQADQVLLNLKIETTYCRENFNINFVGEQGFTNIINRVASEYKKARNLEPLKVCILGPPGVGKSTISKQIAEMYRLNHFTKEDMIKSTIEMLREIAGDESDQDIQGVEMVEMEDKAREAAKSLLAEVDASLQEKPDTANVSSNEDEMAEMDRVSRKSVGALQDEIICRIFRYRLMTNECQNQGFILDGFPETFDQARMLFLAGDDVDDPGEDAGEEGKDVLDPRLVPDKVIILEAPDEFLTNRLHTIPTTELQERHNDKNFPGMLADFRGRMSNYESTFMYYLDLQEMIYYPIDISTDVSDKLVSTIGKISDLLGKPRNYGLSSEEEKALKNGEQVDPSIAGPNASDDLALMESKELEERRNNIQQWMEKLAKIKREEFEREEAALIPLRHYLMAHVVPTLTRGLIEVTRVRPFDPLEFLAEFLFQHNPGSINTASAQKYKADTTIPTPAPPAPPAK